MQPMIVAVEKVRIEQRGDISRRDRSVRYPPGAGRNLDHRLVREHPARSIAHDLHVQLAPPRFPANRLGYRIGAEGYCARIAWNINNTVHHDDLDEVTAEKKS